MMLVGLSGDVNVYVGREACEEQRREGGEWGGGQPRVASSCAVRSSVALLLLALSWHLFTYVGHGLRHHKFVN